MIKKVSLYVKQQCDVLIGLLKVNPMKRLAKMYHAFVSNKKREKFSSIRNEKSKRKNHRRLGWKTKVYFLREKMTGMKMAKSDSIDECNDRIQSSIGQQEPVDWSTKLNYQEPAPTHEPDIFKLDQECFSKVFAWLSAKDLHSLGQTCERMHIITGQYFQQNYPATSIRCDNDGLHSASGGQMNGFSPYIRKVSAFGSGINRLQNISSNCDSLKKLHLDISLSAAKIKCMKPILGEIEELEIENCTFSDRLFKRLLKYCPNLKRLCVRDIHHKTENGWLLRHYPQLIHLELTPWDEYEVDELKEFFELNPNIRSFSTSAKCLWVNRDSIVASQVHVDDLAIEIDSTADLEMESIYSLLDALYTQQFYKRLYLYISNATQQTVDQIASLHALEQLHVSSTIGDVDFTSLINLKEISFHMASIVKNMNDLARSLTNLEGVFFFYASSDDTLPFIRHSPHLTKVKVRNLENGAHFDGKTLYLTAFEKERNKLTNAEKVTIYLNEDIFLTTKWLTEKVDFNFVEIERGDSYNWEHHFRHYLH